MLQLQVGQATPPFGSLQDGVRVLLLCGRDDPQTADEPDFDQIMDRIEEERISKRAQRFLRVNTSFTAHDHWHGSTNHVHDQEHYDAMTSEAKIVFWWYQDCMHDIVDLCADQEHLEWQEDWRASRITSTPLARSTPKTVH